jgi:DNA mismatch repair ATPase MutS
MDIAHLRSELVLAKDERGARAADAARFRGLAAIADTNARALKDAVEKADKESKRIAAEAARAQELADHAEALVGARELLVKAGDAERLVSEAEMQLGVAKARKAPAADLQRLQAVVDKAKAEAPPAADVEQAVKAANAADEQLQHEREQVKLGQQIADLEEQKTRAEQAAKEADATAKRARVGADEATAAVTGLAKQIDEAKGKLKALEAPPAAAPGTGGTGPSGASGSGITNAPPGP